MRFILLILSVFFFSTIAHAETLILNSGEMIEGTVLEENEDMIKMDTGLGVPITYYKDEIKSIEGRPQREEKPAAAQPSIEPLPSNSSNENRKTLQQYFVKGMSYLKHEKYDWAIDEFQSALNMDPEFVDAHYGLSQAYGAKGDRTNAKRHLEEVLKLDNENPAAWMGLGLLDGAEGRIVEAAEKLKKAKDIYARSENLEESQRVVSYLKQFKELLKLKGEHEGAQQIEDIINDVGTSL